MIILAIETSSDACSIALAVNQLSFQKYALLPQQHGHVILTWISELLSEANITMAELDAVVYSAGPGSFTGIRIGAAVGQGIAVAYDIPLIAIPSLNVISQGIYEKFGYSNIKVLLDARVGEVYYGNYMQGTSGLMVPETPDQLTTLNQIPLPLPAKHQLLVTNMPLETLNKEFLNGFSKVVTDYYPQAVEAFSIAREFIKQGNKVNLNEALPLYLRTENSWKKIQN